MRLFEIDRRAGLVAAVALSSRCEVLNLSNDLALGGVSYAPGCDERHSLPASTADAIRECLSLILRTVDEK
jgi:hypothetical protein